MRDWLSSLGSDRVPEIAVALGLGYALVQLADRAVSVPIAILSQQVGRPIGSDAPDDVIGLSYLLNSPYLLNFDIGGTYVAYGPVLAAALALGVVGLVAWLVVRRRDRVLGACPFCASRIPYESTHCAYCGSGVAPGEP